MSRHTVVVTETIHEDGIRTFERSGKADVVLIEGSSPGIALEDVMTEASAMMVRVTRVDRRMMDNAPCLKVIAKHGVGYDNIDVDAATERGIPVTFTPGANAHSVAEHVIGMMLAMSKRVCASHMALKTGRFTRKEDFAGVELWRKTLGIIGLGRIGSQLARKCSRGFEMKVVAFDPFIGEEPTREMDVEIVKALEDLLNASDFVSINCPLTPQTRNLIGEQELKMMKNAAFILNTSRGGIIHEGALYQALTEGWIAGAALDVFVDEPPTTNNPLLGLDNLVVTPHTGGITEEAMSRMATMAAEDILRALVGEKPKHVINPEIYHDNM